MPTRASSECSLLLHHPAMATRLLCWVALCLLGIGESPEIKNLHFFLIFPVLLPFMSLILFPNSVSSTEPTQAEVTQTPRNKVTLRGQGVTLSCEPISHHKRVYWYRQTSVKGLELLFYFQNQFPVEDTGMPKERFSAEMPNGSFSTLKIQPTEPQDSAVYLCASS